MRARLFAHQGNWPAAYIYIIIYNRAELANRGLFGCEQSESGRQCAILNHNLVNAECNVDAAARRALRTCGLYLRSAYSEGL